MTTINPLYYQATLCSPDSSALLPKAIEKGGRFDIRKALSNPDVHPVLNNYLKIFFSGNEQQASRFYQQMKALCDNQSLDTEAVFKALNRDLSKISEPAAVRKNISDFLAKKSVEASGDMGKFIKGIQPVGIGSMIDFGYGDGVGTTTLKNALGISDTSRTVGIEVFDSPVDGLTTVKYSPNSDFLRALQEVQGQNSAIPKQFDLATAVAVLHHTDDPAVTVNSLKQTLKPGGIFLLKDYDVDFATREGRLARDIHDIVDHLHYRVFSDLGDVPITNNYKTKAEWAKIMMDQGLTFIREGQCPSGALKPFMMAFRR